MNLQSYTQLTFRYLCYMENANFAELTLKETEGNRQLCVTIGKHECDAISVYHIGHKLPIPLAQQVILNMMQTLGGQLRYVCIESATDGIFMVDLHVMQQDTLHKIPCRLSDAVALSLQSGCPIFIKTELLQHITESSLKQDTASDSDTALLHLAAGTFNPKAYSLSELEELLQKLVEDEEYEMAAKLRDIIQQEVNQSASSKGEDKLF